MIAEARTDLTEIRDGGRSSLGEELMRPGRIYVRPCEAIAGLAAIHGLAHISGGGVRNLVRLHPKVRFVLDHWPEPSGLFRWLEQLGGLARREMYETFNMGIGFAIIARPVHRSELLRRLARSGAPDARVVGHVERGSGVALPHLDLAYEGYS